MGWSDIKDSLDPSPDMLFGDGGDAARATEKAAEVSASSSVESAEIQAKAYTDAAEISVGAQKDALDYLKEREEIPQHLREESLKTLGELQGFYPDEGSHEEMIQRSIDSPLYQGIMGGKEAGEESILRSASATGGLRSGDTSYNLYDYNVQLQNQALLTSYNEQLSRIQGLAGIPSNANQIANSMSGIGATQASGITNSGLAYASGLAAAGTAQAQGITAGAQTQAQAQQANTNNLMGLGGLALAAYGAFSDRRIKINIKKVGEINGFNFYSFDWNSVANMLGLIGSTYGCMADEVFKTAPEAVSLRNNFMFVNYSMIGVL